MFSRVFLCDREDLSEVRQKKREKNKMTEQKIYFKNLSWLLKIGIVGGLAGLIIYSISFIVGFIEGILLY